MSIIRDFALDCARKSFGAKTLFTLLGALCCLLTTPSANAVTAAAVAAPTLLTPINGASIDRRDPPQLSWQQNQPSASWFRIYINKNGAKYLDFWLPANTYSATNFWTTNSMGAGAYSWWVCAWGHNETAWSSGSTFTVEGIPHAINIISPQGTTESTPSITYAWYAPDDYTSWYELLILTNNKTYSDTWHTVSPTDLQTSTNGQLTQLDLTLKNQPSGVYSWRVRGWSSDGLGPWSTTMVFTNRLAAPGTVTILTPASGAVISNSLPECSWQNNGNPTRNFVHLIRNSSVYTTQWVDGATTWMPTNKLPAGNYTLWLVAWNPDGYGKWSSTSFTVPVRKPGKPVLLGPVGTNCDSSPMTYTWAADANATWYELAIVKNSSTIVDRWFASTASLSSDPSVFEVDVPEQHGAGNYSWWVRGWSPDGYGAWVSTNFMIYGTSHVLPLPGSSWTGNFSELANGIAKTHIIDKLTFNTNGTFVGSGTYQTLNPNPYLLTQTRETYSGTYVLNNGVVTSQQGTAYFTNAYQGTFSFVFSFDSTCQHMTGGTWIDDWDGPQEYDIAPSGASSYVTIINRICGQ
jgi:hypothetical protein